MSKPIVAVDIDEVLFPFLREFSAHHNQKYGTKLSQEDFWTYKFEEVMGVPIDEVLERIFRYHDVDYLGVEPIADASHAMSRLAKKYDIAILTARNAKVRVKTEAWLHRYFGELDFHSITMIGYKEDKDWQPTTKAEVCVDIGAQALVDDSLSHLEDAVKHGVDGILFGNYPWNQAAQLPVGVVRVNDWQALAAHFEV